jgi:DNA-binding NarL/FixJ family response regulator
MAGQPVRVALVNDFEILVAGLAEALAPYSDRVVVVDTAEISEGESAVKRVDVSLFDTFGRTRLGLEELPRLVRDPRWGLVAVYSADEEPAHVQAALAKGAAGYISKATGAKDLVAAIERIAAGESVVAPTAGRRVVGSGWPGQTWGLSLREAEVLVVLTAGLRNREIADALYLSVDTVKTHLRNIYRKLGTNTRSGAAVKALSEPSFARRPPGGP